MVAWVEGAGINMVSRPGAECLASDSPLTAILIFSLFRPPLFPIEA